MGELVLSLVLGWIATAVLVCLFLFGKDFGLTIAIVSVAIIATVTRLLTFKRKKLEISWKFSLDHSRRNEPDGSTIDTDRPLIGLITEGEFVGRYVYVIPGDDGSARTYLVGPGNNATRRERYPSQTLGSDLPISDGRIESWRIRYLDQGDLSDEIWRRNFDSSRVDPNYLGIQKPEHV
jgi:hypothetical protein